MTTLHRSKADANAAPSDAKRTWRELVDAMPIVILVRAVRAALATQPPVERRSTLHTFSR